MRGPAELLLGRRHYRPPAVVFDGTNDYAARGATLSGVANSSRGIISLWVRLAGGDGVAQRLFQDTDISFELVRWSDNFPFFTVWDTSGTKKFQGNSSVAQVAADGWQHHLIAFDTNFAAGSK